MKLFLGKQNLLYYSNQYDNVNGWLSADCTLTGYTLAPDGSSLASVYHSDLANWSNEDLYSSGSLNLFTGNQNAYLISWYVKPVTSSLIRTLLYLVEPTESVYWSSEIRFNDRTVVSYEHLYGGVHRGLINLGYNYVGNGWYKFWGIHDVRDYPNSNNEEVYIRIFPTAASSGYPNTQSVAIWGVQVEESRYRNYPTPLRTTDGTRINLGDFHMVDLTQLPSNIDEIENDFYTTEYNSIGELKRRYTYKDTNVKKLIWEKINYKKHGQMIYWLREALRDKAGHDCVLEYPLGYKKYRRSSDIRIVNFTMDYLTIPDIARIEIDYYIVNTYNY